VLTNTQQQQIVYSLNSQDTVFTLTSKGTYTLCGYTLTRTEHPKLLIFKTSYTPYELVFGKIARIPFNELLPPENKLTNYDNYDNQKRNKVFSKQYQKS